MLWRSLSTHSHTRSDVYVTIQPHTATLQPCPVCWHPVLTVRTKRYGWISLPPHTQLASSAYQRLPLTRCHPCRNDSPRARFRRKG